MNILFVCTGNTCRSPMAEGYARKRYKNHNIKSRGIYADGSPVSGNSVKALAEIGIDISNHISKSLTPEDMLWADKILCMSPSHITLLKRMGFEAELLGNGISDPFGGNLKDYTNCRDQIVAAVDKIFNCLTVVPIDYAHISQIALLEKVCFSCPWSENALTDAFKTGTKFFVCEREGKVLGYVGISAIIDEGYITNIAVFPEYRNQGVGTALLNHLFNFAKENALSFISLEVRESNNDAISLYQKLGFKTEGKRKNFYTAPIEDALIMTKRFD